MIYEATPSHVDIIYLNEKSLFDVTFFRESVFRSEAIVQDKLSKTEKGTNLMLVSDWLIPQ